VATVHEETSDEANGEEGEVGNHLIRRV
jgi:hypothetical protein